MSQRPNINLGRADRLMTWNPTMNIYKVNRFNPLTDMPSFKYSRTNNENRFDIIESLLDRNLIHVVENIFDRIDTETLIYSSVLVCKLWRDFLTFNYLKKWAEKNLQSNSSLKDLARKERWSRYLLIDEEDDTDGSEIDEDNQDMYRKICSRIHQLQEIWRYREPKLRRINCESFVLSCRLSGDKELLTGLNSGILQLWNLDWSAKVKEAVIHDKGIKCLDVSEKYIVSGSYDCTAKLFRRSDWAFLRVITVHTDSVWDLCIHLDKMLITAGLDGTIGIFNINPETEDINVVKILQDHNDLVSAIDYNGQFLVSGYEDARILIRNFSQSCEDFRIIGRLEGHTGGITGLEINTADNTTFASSSYDGTVRLWSLRSDKNQNYPCLKVLTDHEHFVRCLKFHGNILTSGDFGGFVHCWNVEVGSSSVVIKNHRKFAAHKSHIVCIQFTAQKLVTGSRDKTVLIQDFWGKLLETEQMRRKKEAQKEKRISRFLRR